LNPESGTIDGGAGKIIPIIDLNCSENQFNGDKMRHHQCKIPSNIRSNTQKTHSIH